MDRFDSGEIVPGERVGQFLLATPWSTLEPALPRSYVREQRSGVFVARLPSMSFYIDQATQILRQICVFDGFKGTLKSGIGIGSTGREVAEALGMWIEDDEDHLIVPDYPGVSFEVKFTLGHDVDWQLQHSPIAWICVYPTPSNG